MSTNRPPQLVMMAAGMSRRFGTLKQLDVLESCDHSLPEFVLHDAISAGFHRIIIVVRDEIRAAMESFYTPRFSHRAELCFVSQSLDDIPSGIQPSHGRSKPWGTAHAVLAARDCIDAPFATVNSDDFYGRSALANLYKALSTTTQDSQFFLVSYALQNTLSEFGPVSRALCKTNKGSLTHLEEHPKLTQKGHYIASLDAGGREIARFTGKEPVSMNLYGLGPLFLEYAWHSFAYFLQEGTTRPEEVEFLLPAVMQSMIQEKKASVQLIPCSETWFGMTYPQDRPLVATKLSALQNLGTYTDMLRLTQ